MAKVQKAAEDEAKGVSNSNPDFSHRDWISAKDVMEKGGRHTPLELGDVGKSVLAIRHFQSKYVPSAKMDFKSLTEKQAKSLGKPTIGHINMDYWILDKDLNEITEDTDPKDYVLVVRSDGDAFTERGPFKLDGKKHPSIRTKYKNRYGYIELEPYKKDAKKKKTESTLPQAKKYKKKAEPKPAEEVKEEPKEEVVEEPAAEEKPAPKEIKPTQEIKSEGNNYMKQIDDFIADGNIEKVQQIARHSEGDIQDQVALYWVKEQREDRLTEDNAETANALTAAYEQFLAGREYAQQKLGEMDVDYSVSETQKLIARTFTDAKWQELNKDKPYDKGKLKNLVQRLSGRGMPGPEIDIMRDVVDAVEGNLTLSQFQDLVNEQLPGLEIVKTKYHPLVIPSDMYMESPNTYYIELSFRPSKGELKDAPRKHSGGLHGIDNQYAWVRLGMSENEDGTLHVFEIQSDFFQSRESYIEDHVDYLKTIVRNRKIELRQFDDLDAGESVGLGYKIYGKDEDGKIYILRAESKNDEKDGMNLERIRKAKDGDVVILYGGIWHGPYIIKRINKNVIRAEKISIKDKNGRYIKEYHWEDTFSNLGEDQYTRHEGSDKLFFRKNNGGLRGIIDTEKRTADEIIKDTSDEIRSKEETIDKGGHIDYWKTHQNLWHKRIIRELLAWAKENGYEKVRFPTAKTVAYTEKWLDTQDKIIGADVGDWIDYHAGKAVVVDDRGDEKDIVQRNNLMSLGEINKEAVIHIDEVWDHYIKTKKAEEDVAAIQEYRDDLDDDELNSTLSITRKAIGLQLEKWSWEELKKITNEQILKGIIKKPKKYNYEVFSYMDKDLNSKAIQNYIDYYADVKNRAKVHTKLEPRGRFKDYGYLYYYPENVETISTSVDFDPMSMGAHQQTVMGFYDDVGDRKAPVLKYIKSLGDVKKIGDKWYEMTLTDKMRHPVPAFSKAQPQKTGYFMSSKELKEELSDLVDWQNAPHIKVVDRVENLPWNTNTQQFENDKRIIQGAKYRDKVYFVATNIRAEDAKGVFLHELGVHYSLPKILGRKEFANLINQVSRSKDRRVKAARALVPEGTPAHKVNEEIVAYLVEKHHNDLSFIKRVIAMVRRWLRSIGMVGAYTPNDAIYLAAHSARAYRSLDEVQVGGEAVAYSKTDPDQLMANIKNRIKLIDKKGLRKDFKTYNATWRGKRSFMRSNYKDYDPKYKSLLDAAGAYVVTMPDEIEDLEIGLHYRANIISQKGFETTANVRVIGYETYYDKKSMIAVIVGKSAKNSEQRAKLPHPDELNQKGSVNLADMLRASNEVSRVKNIIAETNQRQIAKAEDDAQTLRDYNIPKIEAGAVQAEWTAPKGLDSKQKFYVPKNIYEEQALAQIDTERWLINRGQTFESFLNAETGIPVEKMSEAFTSRQMVALTQAIIAHQDQRGFILGDQTGAGKGRVIAGMALYAMRRGITPIFITKEHKLYADMVRDLVGIGAIDYVPKTKSKSSDMFNKINIMATDDKGEVELARDGIKIDRMQKGSGAYRNYDAIFTTYNQLAPVGGMQNSRRHRIVKAMANDAMILMDESHRAGGSKDSGDFSTATFLRDVIHDAHLAQVEAKDNESEANGGVLYASATFSKSPDTMSLYLTTYIGRMLLNNIITTDELNDIIARGGHGLTEVITRELARRGEYSRVELDNSGVQYNFNNAKVSEESYKDVSAGLAKLFVFDKKLQAERDKISMKMGANERGVIEGYQHDGKTYDKARLNFGEFPKTMHNLRQQAILSLKTQGMIDEALAAIERDEKPVVVLFNTNESFLSYMLENSVQNFKIDGDFNTTLADMYQRYSDTSLKWNITVKGTGSTSDVKERGFIDLKNPLWSDREHILDELKKDKTLGSTEYPVSPIDAFIKALKDKGYNAEEITGRSLGVDYSDKTPKLVSRARERHNEIIGRFNSGKTDALIMNQSGSTGISLHSSETFEDQRKRVMIVPQGLPDPNDMVQIFGRVNRLRQKHPPGYTILTAPIPSEVRDLSALVNKLSSVNAFVAGDNKSMVEGKGTINTKAEFANIVVKEHFRYSKHGARFNDEMFEPVTKKSEGDIARILNRVSILPPDEQREVIDTIVNLVGEREKAMDMAGIATGGGIVNLGDVHARVIDEKQIGGGNYVRHWMMDRKNKPIPEEVAYRRVLEKLGDDGEVSNIDWDAVRERSKEMIKQRIDAAYALAALGEVTEGETEQYQLMHQRDSFKRGVDELLHGGSAVRLITADGIINQAIITDVTLSKTDRDHLDGQNWGVNMIIPALGQAMTVRVNKLAKLRENQGADALSSTELGIRKKPTTIKAIYQRLEAMPMQEEVEVIHGDMIASMVETGGKGVLKSFIDENGVRQIGLFIPKNTSYEKLRQSRDISITSGSALLGFAKSVGSVIKVKVAKARSVSIEVNTKYMRIHITNKAARFAKLFDDISAIIKPADVGRTYASFNVYEDNADRVLDAIMRQHKLTIDKTYRKKWDDFNDAMYSVRFESPRAENIYQESKEAIKVESRLARGFRKLWAGRVRLYRHFQYLDESDPFNVDVAEKLKQLENASIYAHEKVSNNLKRVMFGLSADEQDTLNRYFLLKDLAWTAGQGKKVPMSFTLEEIQKELPKFESLINASETLKQRVAARDKIHKELRAELLRAGVLKQEQLQNTDYYRHQVLEHYSLMNSPTPGGNTKLRRMKQFQRKGSEKAINTDYFSAEENWMTRAYMDIATANFLSWMKPSKYSLLDEMRGRAKATNKLNVMEMLRDEAIEIVGKNPDVFKGVTDSMIEGINTPQALRKFLRSAAKDAGESDIEGLLPKLDAYMEHNEKIAKTLSSIRNEMEKLPIARIPPIYQDAYKRFIKGKDTAAAEEPSQKNNLFGLIGFLAMQDDLPQFKAFSSIFYKTIAMREALIKQMLGKEYINYKSNKALVKHYAPNGEVVLWQPDSNDGKIRRMHFYSAKSISNYAYETIQHEMMDMLEKKGEIDGALLEDLMKQMKDTLVQGGPMEEYAIPKDLADTLNDFHDRPLDSFIVPLFAELTYAIKKLFLFAPWKLPRYILNNLSGDLDASIQSGRFRAIMKNIPAAFRMVRDVMWRGKEMSELYKEAYRQGVFHSNITIADLYNPYNYQVNQFSDLDVRASNRDLYKKIAHQPGRYFRFAQKIAITRENIFRLAGFMVYKDLIDSGQSLQQIGYAASDPKVLKNISDPADLAGRLARDLFGDYNNISYSGRYIARFWVLFYRWMETNFRRESNFIMNIYRYPRDIYLAEQSLGAAGKTAGEALAMASVRAALLSMRLVMFYTVIQFLRHMFFDDDELENTEERIRLHLPVARFGDEIWTMRMQGAFSDYLGFFGFEDVGATFREVMSDRASPLDVVKGISKATPNRFLNAMNPFVKIPVELGMTGKMYPDAFNPSPIRDPWYIYVPQTVGLGPEVRGLADALGNIQPTKDYSRRFAQMLFYVRTTDEMAWQNARNIVYRFQDYSGKDFSFRGGTEKGDLLRKLFNAKRFDDKEAERKLLAKLAQLRVRRDDIQNSMYRRGLLGALKYRMNDRDRVDFYKTLSLKEYDIIKKGLVYESKALHGDRVMLQYRKQIAEMMRFNNRARQ